MHIKGITCIIKTKAVIPLVISLIIVVLFKNYQGVKPDRMDYFNVLISIAKPSGISPNTSK